MKKQNTQYFRKVAEVIAATLSRNFDGNSAIALTEATSSLGYDERRKVETCAYSISKEAATAILEIQDTLKTYREFTGEDYPSTIEIKSNELGIDFKFNPESEDDELMDNLNDNCGPSYELADSYATLTSKLECIDEQKTVTITEKDVSLSADIRDSEEFGECCLPRSVLEQIANDAPDDKDEKTLCCRP